MRTKSLIEKPEHFVVHEIIDDKFTRLFSRTSKGVQKIEKKYTLYIMKKTGTTTQAALATVAKYLDTSRDSIGYAGLKDKFAVTTQHITLKDADFEELDLGNVRLFKLGYTDKQISVGSLKGNHFVITLRRTRVKDPGSAVRKINQEGFPNFFGEQRFGNRCNNHIIGGLLVKRDFKEALKLINGNEKNKFKKIDEVEKRRLKFFVHAYQSWIFNTALSECIKKKLAVKNLRIVGCNTVLRNSAADKLLSKILAKQGVKPPDFKIHELKLSCSGTQRAAFVKTEISFNTIDDYIQLYFTLPKGSYATVVLAQLIKGSS